jgi:hypothetical protein
MDIHEFIGDYDFLSNDYESPITYGSRNFSTVSEAFQSSSSLLRRPETWETRQVIVMRAIVFRKFLQNANLATKLVSTDTTPLINGGAWQDPFWGYDTIQKFGEDHLGVILMKIRAFLMWTGV